jgi:hypothetical protein
MPDDIKLLLQSIGQHLFETGQNAGGTVAILITETTKFRDKLKEETGYILTVEDTRRALDGLEAHLNKMPMPDDLTEEQKTLAQIYIDRLTVF